mmetsp:Transcript_13016/g.15543  ORF Transcript_13016/g.15543 Transcript_13016/m.15543 type:complete len:249 (+) Transcript_13016:71-817(+)
MDFPLFRGDERPVKKRKKKEQVDEVILNRVLEQMAPIEETTLPVQLPNDRSKEETIPPPLNPTDSPTLAQDIPLKLYIGGIGKNIKKCHLEAEFVDHVEMSEIREFNLVTDKASGIHKGFAFIELVNATAARSILELNGCELLGSELSVRPAQEKRIPVQGNQSATRRFGSLDYSAIALQVDKRHKHLVAEQIATNEAAREAYLITKAKKEEDLKQFVASGGKVPGGYGHGLAKGKPKLHSGYSNFDA